MGRVIRQYWKPVVETVGAFVVALIMLYCLGFVFPSISFSEMRKATMEREMQAQRFTEWEQSQNRVAKQIDSEKEKR